jgi:rare lipoprotein A
MKQYTILILLTLSFKTLAQKATTEGGYACIYSKNLHGKPTASGERFDINKLTAAHRHFKFGTRVKVTNLKNKKSVVVKINDRGPFTKKYVIDLSLAAAKQLGFGYHEGKAQVKLEKL